MAETLSGMADRLRKEVSVARSEAAAVEVPAAEPAPMRVVERPTAPARPALVRNSSGKSDTSLPAGERAVLAVLAQYQDGLQRTQIGVFSGYVKRSTRDAYLQRLQTKGCIGNTGDGVRIAFDGLSAVGDYEPLPIGRDLQEWWLAKLPKGEAEILGVLCTKPSGFSREDIGQLTGYKARSTRDAYIQRLSQKMLIDVSGAVVRASENLFG